MITFVSVHIPSKYEASYYTILLLFLTLKPPLKYSKRLLLYCIHYVLTFTLLYSLSLTLLKLHVGGEIFFTHCKKRISDFKICDGLEENLNSQWHEFKIQHICCKFLRCLQINSYSVYFYLLKTYHLCIIRSTSKIVIIDTIVCLK